MRYEDSLLKRILDIPKEEWNKGHYAFILKFPIIFFGVIFGIFIAIIVDFMCANEF